MELELLQHGLWGLGAYLNSPALTQAQVLEL